MVPLVDPRSWTVKPYPAGEKLERSVSWSSTMSATPGSRPTTSCSPTGHSVPAADRRRIRGPAATGSASPGSAAGESRQPLAPASGRSAPRTSTTVAPSWTRSPAWSWRVPVRRCPFTKVPLVEPRSSTATPPSTGANDACLEEISVSAMTTSAPGRGPPGPCRRWGAHVRRPAPRRSPGEVRHPAILVEPRRQVKAPAKPGLRGAKALG